MKKIIIFPILILLLVSCNNTPPPVADWDAYMTEHKEWQDSRLERLKSENGWLNLAGLLWLDEGENTFGSDLANNIVFPEGFAENGGTIVLKDSTLTLLVDKEVDILVDGEAMKEATLKHDQQKEKTIMELGQYRWFIIKRGERYAIRLRDLEHPRIAQVDHIPAYEFNQDYVVTAELIPFDTLRTVEVPTAIPGFMEYYKVPGELKFKLQGKEQRLLPFKSGKGYFLIVGDATNGMDTYGAGRFMSAKVTEDNVIILDFNKATNPPCAFTPFATCPLPPLENILDIEIKAGEKGSH